MGALAGAVASAASVTAAVTVTATVTATVTRPLPLRSSGGCVSAHFAAPVVPNSTCAATTRAAKHPPERPPELRSTLRLPRHPELWCPLLPAEDHQGSETIGNGLLIRDYIRNSAKTDYHPVGSCKMGIDELAVVDPELRVHGLEGLRVIDSSIMPNIISGNTQAPSTMIGEKGAAMVIAGKNV